MLGLMSERPLLISSIITHAATYHGDVEIVSRTVEGPIHRYTYRDAERRSKQLARALLRLGIEPGDRVATLAWNTFRHFELYYAISGIGAVCHTINPRLFDDQIVYIVNHAADRLLFVDTTFLPLVERLAPRLPPDCRIVPMTDAGECARNQIAGPAVLRAADRGRRRRISPGPNSTSAPPLRSATPPAPPAIPRALCTATARRCCTPSASRCPTRSRSRRPTLSARSCRCFTPAAGASRMRCR